MATNLTVNATERSTYVITAAFTDEDGAAVVPNAITWTLTDTIGTVINSRDGVAVAVPASSIDIVLSGADLAVGGYNSPLRIFTIEATYNSALGNDLPLTGAAQFSIEALAGV